MTIVVGVNQATSWAAATTAAGLRASDAGLAALPTLVASGSFLCPTLMVASMTPWSA